MRILISIIRFEPEKTLGSEIFLKSFLESLPKVLDKEKIAVVGSENTCEWGGKIAGELTWMPMEMPESSFGRMFFERRNIEAVARKWNAKVVYFPFNIMPKIKTPGVLLLHDLVNEFYCKRFPFYRPFYYRYVRRMVRRSIKNADAVITISQAVADELKSSSFFDGGKKIYVSPLAVNRHIENQKKPKSAANNNRKIILQPGAQLPHKSHITGIKAMLEVFRINPQVFNEHQLVLTGGVNRDAELSRFIKKNNFCDNISFLGRLEYEELEWMMQNCEAVVFPTLYEGFGLGIVDAQLRGKSVIASDIPVSREISGGAAVFFEPENEKDLARKIVKTLAAGNDRLVQLKLQGIENVNKRHWENHSREVLNFLKITAET